MRELINVPVEANYSDKVKFSLKNGRYLASKVTGQEGTDEDI